MKIYKRNLYETTRRACHEKTKIKGVQVSQVLIWSKESTQKVASKIKKSCHMD